MSFIPLNKFRVINNGWELVVTPNSSSSFTRGNDDNEEIVLAEDPLVYGVQIPFKAYGDNKCRIIYTESPALLQPLRLWQNTEYDFALKIPLRKDEFVHLAKTKNNPIYPFKYIELNGYFTFNSTYACWEHGEFYFLTGRFNFKEFSGQAHLDIDTPSGVIPLVVEVMTSKLTYEKDYVSLIKELSNICSEVILQLDAPVTVQLKLDYEKDVSPHAYMLHLRRLFEEGRLPTSIAMILNQPNSRFYTSIEKEESAFVSRPCIDSIASNPFEHDWYKGGVLENSFYGFTPKTLPSRETKQNFNTIENQFIKAFLNRLIYKIEELIEQLPGKYTASHFNLRGWHNMVSQWKSHSLWRDVTELKKSPNSMVLIARNGYREAFLDYLSFDLSIRFEGQAKDLVGDGQLKPVWELYQIWCYFKLYECLKDVSGGDGKPGLESIFNKKIFDIRLKEGSKSKISFKFTYLEKIDVELNLYHNRTFSRKNLRNNWSEVYSGFYHPDFSIEIIANKSTYWVHFDAKYKLNLKEWEQEIFCGDEKKENNSLRSIERPNLDKVHSYRDAILGTRGSFILFPGYTDKQSVYVRHADVNYRASFPGPSIGAFPLRPSADSTLTALQTRKIKNLIFEFLDCMVESNSYIEESGFCSF